MNILAKAEKVLENYNAQIFSENLEKELDNKGIKKGVFCRKIGRASNWVSRLKNTKELKLETLIAIEKEFNIDILKLAGIESKNTTIRIPYEKDIDKETIIQGVKVNLNIFYHKVEVLLSYQIERETLISYVDYLYKILQSRTKIKINLKENTI